MLKVKKYTSLYLESAIITIRLFKLSYLCYGILLLFTILILEDVLLQVDEFFSNSFETLRTKYLAPELAQQIITKSYNLQYKDTIFGFRQQFRFKLKGINSTNHEFLQIKLLGFDNVLIPNSLYDYENISQKVNFTKLEEKMFETIPYKLHSYHYDNKKQVPELLNIQHFNYSQTSEETNLKYKNLFGVDPTNPTFTFQLGKKIAQQISKKEVKQAQYFYYDNLYQIGSYKQQIPICVFATGFQLWKKQRFRQFFQTIEKLNYTNFHIVYVDDKSSPGSLNNILNYLSSSNSRLKNRIVIIENLIRLFGTANKFFYIKRYCRQNDLVVLLDPDDAILGYQGFKVLNSIYQNENIWYSSSHLLTKQKGDYSYFYSQPQFIKSPESLFKFQLNWLLYSLKVYRYKLYKKMCLQSWIQYKRYDSSNYTYPIFPKYGSDVIEIHSMLQMGGLEHLRMIPSFFYLYIGSTITLKEGGNCSRGFQLYGDLKYRLRFPYKKLNSLQDHPEFIKQFHPQVLNQMKQNITKYFFIQKCLLKNIHPISGMVYQYSLKILSFYTFYQLLANLVMLLLLLPCIHLQFYQSEIQDRIPITGFHEQHKLTKINDNYHMVQFEEIQQSQAGDN